MLPLDLNLQMAMGRYGHKEERYFSSLRHGVDYGGFLENMTGMVTEKKDVFLL